MNIRVSKSVKVFKNLLEGGYLISFIVGVFFSWSLVFSQFTGKLTKPFSHSVDLFGGLEFTFFDISLGPFRETFGNLLNTTDWVVFIVPAETGFLIDITN